MKIKTFREILKLGVLKYNVSAPTSFIIIIIIIIRNLYSAIMPLGGYRGAEAATEANNELYVRFVFAICHAGVLARQRNFWHSKVIC